jgi:exopolyphosphatase/guanosine-5'-triphosphate,3'-diphosphate pyrophosphatase
MSALLRLADGLDRTHRSLVEDIQIEYVDNIAQAYIVSKESCELEVWYTKQIASYFEEVFKKKIVVKLFTPTSSSN